MLTERPIERGREEEGNEWESVEKERSLHSNYRNFRRQGACVCVSQMAAWQEILLAAEFQLNSRAQNKCGLNSLTSHLHSYENMHEFLWGRRRIHRKSKTSWHASLTNWKFLTPNLKLPAKTAGKFSQCVRTCVCVRACVYACVRVLVFTPSSSSSAGKCTPLGLPFKPYPSTPPASS